MRKTTVRLAAAGALTVAALAGTAGAAQASNDYAPNTPTPSVSDVVTPSVSPTTGGSVSPSGSVTPGAVGDSSDELAYTGADVAPWAAAGTVLVLGGVAMVVAARRKPARKH